ncbi:hypothetical protein B5V00_11125 [Geothermobacter hydrogeniphilus]|uniref:Type IV pilus assembly protein PilP n=1 Tax=Geothermobacter hydrogeniphilus TaxID=1969733 RepID=A0A1X0Y1S9_9BACT|nr:hypothetical protein B5V00_11125 [Geothermobacter hydrogeniphilus]
MRAPLIKKILLVAGLCGFLLVGGCDDSPPASVKAPAAKVKPVKRIAKKVQNKKPQPKKPDYVYSSAGLRDPFVPLFEEKKPITAKKTPLTPLQKFDLAQFRILGIIVGKGEPSAMVAAPGGKSYILKKGLKIGKNNGTVTAITPDGITVMEKYYDFTGAVRTNKKMIKLPPHRGVN